MNTPKSRPVDQAVLEVLADGVSTDGHLLKITRQLERPLYTAVNKVLEAAGGKWNRSAKAHVFFGSAEDAMEQIILTGQIAVPEDFGQFFTPDALAQRIIDMADIKPGMHILEPSAGQGALALRAAQACMGVEIKHDDGSRSYIDDGHVACCEILPHNRQILDRRGFHLIGDDFMALRGQFYFDRVVMNPPFAKRADVHHITKAHGLLRPDGKLVAIASAAVEFRDDRLGREFRALVASHNGTIEPLPPGSFKESGTMVNTVIVTMDGPRT